MSYKTYTTDAIVCGSRDRNGADRVFWLLTKDAGMVIARARSVRETKSKLRYALQDFSTLTVSLIRGKHEWQVIGVEPRDNLYYAGASREGRAALLRAVRLLRRLLPGEEAHPALFTVAEDGLKYLASIREPAPDIEQLFVVRVLSRLGYVASADTVAEIIEYPSLKDACVSMRNVEAGGIVRKIAAEALTASQL